MTKKQLGAITVTGLIGATGGAAAAERPMNVLLLFVDDLKPLMGCYGDPIAKTPNMDALAARGALFKHAACQVSLCAPSRASILTGLRPDTLSCYTNTDKLRKTKPDIVTLPQAFQREGYYTVSVGKVFDPRVNDPASWNELFLGGSDKKIYALEENNRLFDENNARYEAASAKEKQNLWRVGPAYEIGPPDESAYFDGQVVRKAIETLRRIKDKPFFLGVGVTKPHLPFSCPRKYWEIYDRAQIPLPPNPDRPTEGVVAMAYHDGFELRQFQDIPRSGKLDDELARTLIHGYYACTSFADDMIGRVLTEIDSLGLKDNTIIVLLGDNGWHLGDKGIWCKLTAFQEASMVPLIVVDPRRKGGTQINGLVEFVDICPTLCELTGVAQPEQIEGTSFVPLLDHPSKVWKTAVFSQVGRGTDWKEFIGTSMRTERYNYVEWRHRTEGTLRATELYDLEKDPREMVNLAENPEYKSLLSLLAEQMKAGWQKARPENK